MRRIWLIAIAVPVLALAVASFVSLPRKLIYNASASAPIGLYWLDSQPVERGDYVLVRVPDRVRLFVEERGYLAPNVPFVKRVVGLNGDRVCRQSGEISVNGSVVATAKKRDGQGREMPVWHGCHILTERRVFVLGVHPQSFDGRYFGPVDRRLIIGRATRIRLH